MLLCVILIFFTFLFDSAIAISFSVFHFGCSILLVSVFFFFCLLSYITSSILLSLYLFCLVWKFSAFFPSVICYYVRSLCNIRAQHAYEPMRTRSRLNTNYMLAGQISTQTTPVCAFCFDAHVGGEQCVGVYAI